MRYVASFLLSTDCSRINNPTHITRTLAQLVIRSSFRQARIGHRVFEDVGVMPPRPCSLVKAYMSYLRHFRGIIHYSAGTLSHLVISQFKSALQGLPSSS